MTARGASSLVVTAVTVRAGGARLLDDVSLTVRAGELTVLVGENGAGKSTLLDRVAGLSAPDLGQVTLDGARLDRLPPRERARRVASCAQSAPAPPDLTVAARIGQGLAPRRGFSSLLDGEARTAVRGVAEELGVEALLERRLETLSGGELRRVQVARALVDDQALAYILDEPHAGVDVRHQPLVSEALRRRARAGRIVVASVHDLAVALELADRVVGLRSGAIVVDGPPEEALDREAIRAVFGVAGEIVRAPSGGRTILVNPRA